MTGSGVEREQRAAYLSASGAPVGVSPSMPPHSQGAERRRGRRWGLRALIVGGLAGAAWLLSGAAAHAADRHPTAEGSLLGSVVSGVDQARVLDVATGPLKDVATGPLKDVARPLKDVAVRPLKSDRRGLGSVTELPSELVRTLDAATHDGVIRELTAPLRLAGETVDTRNLTPVTNLRPTAPAVPATDAGEPAEAPAAVTAADLVGSGSGDEVLPAVERELDRRMVVGKTVARRHAIAAVRHPAAARAAPPVTVRDTPGGDGPAPLRVHLGAANGVPALGSGAGTDGGSAAVVPAKVADSTVACHRLPIATDVEVRRYDAGAPTVSPD